MHLRPTSKLGYLSFKIEESMLRWCSCTHHKTTDYDVAEKEPFIESWINL